MSSPCEHCPWRKSNHGKRTPWGFYTKANLTRLWNQVRGGGKKQSCHPTDPNHPDHVLAGAKPGSKPVECAGSVIVVLREALRMSEGDADNTISPESMLRYQRTRKKGLKHPHGVAYWLIERIQHGSLPLIGGGELPSVDVDDPEIDLPEYLKEPL